MDQDKAVNALAALGQSTRLSVFRKLVQAGPDGMTAGDIAVAVSSQPSTMSHHLGLLERTGLVKSRRDGRMVVYAADYAGTRALLTFLTEDCCAGSPELCGEALVDSILCENGTRMTTTIYHNPACGTSRNTLAIIRASGTEPEVIEYLQAPPSRDRLIQLMRDAGLSPRDLLREKGTPYAELGLADPSLTDEQLIDAMMKHPLLINRPLVETSRGVRLCRPSEAVLDILERPLAADFVKEDGEVVPASARA